MNPTKLDQIAQRAPEEKPHAPQVFGDGGPGEGIFFEKSLPPERYFLRNVAVITLSREGLVLAERLAERFPDWRLYVHVSLGSHPKALIFSRIADLTREVFSQFRGLVYIAPCGVAVRALAPNLRSKLEDPAVVVLDVGGRYAVSLLSGHEGGANELALTVANTLAAEPVISTTTEARKRLIVGVGCKRGTGSESIVGAIRQALSEISASEDHVRLLASADVKADEQGLLDASRELGISLRFIASDEIRSSTREFCHSPFVEEKVNLPAVAEPAALLAGRRTRLLLPKRRFNGVTVAVAQEDCMWSE